MAFGFPLSFYIGSMSTIISDVSAKLTAQKNWLMFVLRLTRFTASDVGILAHRHLKAVCCSIVWGIVADYVL